MRQVISKNVVAPLGCTVVKMRKGQSDQTLNSEKIDLRENRLRDVSKKLQNRGHLPWVYGG